MSDTVQIAVAVQTGDSADQIDQLKSAFNDFGAQWVKSMQTMRQADAAYVQAFKNNMQVMVDAKQITLQQALGYDIQYTAQLSEQEQERLAEARDNDQLVVSQRQLAAAMMQQVDERYILQSSQDYRQLADAARSSAERVARSYEQAFDRVGDSVQRTFNEILTRQTTWAKGMNRIVQEVDSFFLEQVESMAAKWAASGLASLAGGAVAGAVGGAQATGASGLGAGLMALLGINQPGGIFGSGLLSGSGGASTVQATAVAANTTALTASTTAMSALTAALTGATAADTTTAGASLAGGATAAAGGGGLFSWAGGLLGFARGGIVPSAAGGWALPNFAGATPALLHAREMVLPADISQGMQGMIAAGGGGGAQFHAHFHGPADAPAISRWFRENLKSNAGALRDLFRQNVLTPRSF